MAWDLSWDLYLSLTSSRRPGFSGGEGQWVSCQPRVRKILIEEVQYLKEIWNELLISLQTTVLNMLQPTIPANSEVQRGNRRSGRTMLGSCASKVARRALQHRTEVRVRRWRERSGEDSTFLSSSHETYLKIGTLNWKWQQAFDLPWDEAHAPAGLLAR